MHELKSFTLEDLTVLLAEMAQLREENVALRARVAELEARLNKDSHNSSKPPTSDSPYRKPQPKSLRQPSGRKPGGQKGHEGSTLRQAEQADIERVHGPSGLCTCGRPWEEGQINVLPEPRQEIGLLIQRVVTDHRIGERTCGCGRVARGVFPQGIRGAVQYGPSVQGLATYLTQSDFLPYERAAQFFDEVAGIALSPATLAAANTQASNRLLPIVEGIRGALVRAEVAHADESGMRVGGKLHWLHVLGTAELTAYWIHPKRGQEALEAIGLLRHFNGILVHDHWSAYAVYGCLHAMCNAHHLRELIGIQETTGQGWPEPLMTLLLAGKAEADQARHAGAASLSAERLAHYHAEYARILAAAEALNPANTQPTGRRGRIKQTPPHNLLRRLRKHQDDTLRYLADLRVPFDNNQAERDIRMPKCKQKISGGFRTREGAETFAIIRSYLSTLRKQSINLYQSLVLTFQGRPPLPQLG